MLGFREQVLCQLRRVQEAAELSDITVLLEGETETGKLVLASSIHQLGRREIAIPLFHFIAALSARPAESELFGHHRGAFSGAVAERRELFQSAQHGTLLEISANAGAPSIRQFLP